MNETTTATRERKAHVRYPTIFHYSDFPVWHNSSSLPAARLSQPTNGRKRENEIEQNLIISSSNERERERERMKDRNKPHYRLPPKYKTIQPYLDILGLIKLLNLPAAHQLIMYTDRQRDQAAM